jgi:hypothetical protein
MKHYRAIRSSYGFRGRYWEKDEIAENVTEDENIPDHFEPLPEGEAPEKQRDESFEPPEPETLSDWQKHENQSEPAPGLEDRKPKHAAHPKSKRK